MKIKIKICKCDPQKVVSVDEALGRKPCNMCNKCEGLITEDKALIKILKEGKLKFTKDPFAEQSKLDEFDD